MIKTDEELETTQKRVRQFERQVAQIRKTETDLKTFGCLYPGSSPRLTG